MTLIPRASRTSWLPAPHGPSTHPHLSPLSFCFCFFASLFASPRPLPRPPQEDPPCLAAHRQRSPGTGSAASRKGAGARCTLGAVVPEGKGCGGLPRAREWPSRLCSEQHAVSYGVVLPWERRGENKASASRQGCLLCLPTRGRAGLCCGGLVPPVLQAARRLRRPSCCLRARRSPTALHLHYFISRCACTRVTVPPVNAARSVASQQGPGGWSRCRRHLPPPQGGSAAPTRQTLRNLMPQLR